MASRRPLSGIQKQVLSLYRSALRTAREMPSEQRVTTQKYIQQELGRHRDIKKTEYMRIEYLIRKGWKQLEVVKMPQTTGVRVQPGSSSSSDAS
mmetsp:Transcript_23574/g.65388  ORF Transcript_23574/g.65388 Transcript_23574/m.65388 type:complete len:94 (+) Transcript_23574:253-534(+)|eukprot:CAMPEP_0117654846 /NCGR_PEP_ID=MMETSP0804-20121206/3965_1 /TAXON_ID=1074897 /ORGANISM="Tetraselmis astigmatica, Strain CCMP880" /LENGTH=93 /DNA_ID=CAMNT_0005461161 /DNA_START=196 /DNA_END=477 /DNA_ORIENTATION=+